MGRLVTLALVTPAGEPLGSLPPFRVDPPWWSEVASLVAAAAAFHSADVTVLRLLGASSQEPGTGGTVRYLAELHGPVPTELLPVDGALDDDPRRVPWAHPGGPAADLAWADDALERLGRPRTGRALQLRTWNLSSIWRLPTAAGDVWLKVVPPLLAHEGAVLDALDRLGAPVPPLLAHDGGGRVLLDSVPGENQWRPEPDRLLAMVSVLLELQAAWRRREGELLALGVNDWRPASFVAAAGETVASWAPTLPPPVAHALDRLVDGLDARFVALEACGLPDTLVHCDFHPGNFRSDGTSLVLLDWGDCGVGHPVLDLAGFVECLDPRGRGAVERAWREGWSTLEPGSDTERARRLGRPLAALRRAVAYHRFVEAFEPDERVYHERDVPRWLAAAVGALAPSS